MVNKFSKIKERVIQISEYQNDTKENFYKKIGMTSANFRGKAKETPLNSNTIENIITNFSEINLHWLLTGKGTMLLDNNEENTAAEPAAVYKPAAMQEKEDMQVAVLKEKIQLLEEKVKDKEKIISLQEDRLKEREEKITKDDVFIQRLKKQLAELQEKWAELNKKLLVEKKDYRSLMDAGGSVPSKLPANKPSIVPAERNIKKQRPHK